jgi:hypothetical protein
MANVFATKTGTWSDVTVWNTGALPTSADDVYANNFTVTINQNVTVLSLRTTSASGINQGGAFNNSGNWAVVANIISGSSTALNITGSGTTLVTGDITGSSISAVSTLSFNSTGTLNLIGNLTGGSTNDSYVVTNASTGTVNITGNVLAGSGGNHYGARNLSGGTMNINGNVTGGTNTNNSIGCYNAGLGTMVISGSSTGGIGGVGAVNFGGGTLVLQKAVGSTTSSAVGLNGNNSLGITIVKSMEFGPNGQVPVSGFVRYDNTAPINIKVTREDNSTVTLVDLSDIDGELPAPADVRAGVGYNSNTRVGTMQVPAASDTRKGVLVDVADVGTALLNAEDVWNYPAADCNVPGSIGQRLTKTISEDVVGELVTALSTK